MQSHRFHAGNVLFIILIAVALFAALSFTVSHMMRGGSVSVISEEKAEIYAAEIIDIARQTREAVRQSRLQGNCEDTDLSFDTPVLTGYEHTPAADDGCQIFGALNPVGVNYKTPPPSWLDEGQSAQSTYGHWFFIGESCVYSIGTGDADCASSNADGDSDLIAVMPWLNINTCLKINERLNIPAAGNGRPPSAGSPALSATPTPFTGEYAQNGSINSSGTDAAYLTAAPAGCFEGAGTPPSGSFHCYQVLLGR